MSDTTIQTPEDKDGLIAYIFTNDKERAGYLHQLLDLYYRGVFDNTIGIMVGKQRDTGEEHTLIVGVAHGQDGLTSTFPLARVLGPEEASRYVGPDLTTGGWLDEELEEEVSE